MKSFFTTLLLTMIIANIFAQTNSEFSGNSPIKNGYQFNFNPSENGLSDITNCIGDKIKKSQNYVTSATIDTINGYLSLDISLEKDKTSGYQMLFSEGNCSHFTYGIRENISGDSIISVKIKSSIDINGISFVLNGIHPEYGWVAPADKDMSYCSISANEWKTLVFKSSTKTWDNYQLDKNKFYGISILMKNNDNIDYLGKLEIDYIQIGGDQNTSSTCNVITDNTEKIKKENIIIYPNPANNVLNITMNGSYEVSLFNMLGNIVFYQENEDNSSLDISTLPTGIYYTQITKNGELLKTEKIIIN